MKDVDAAVNLRGQVTCEGPNDQLYKFEGTIKFSHQPDHIYSLDHTSLLLRGTSMKNTDWIIGMVVYTGHETKIMKNSCKSRTKFSLLET